MKRILLIILIMAGIQAATSAQTTQPASERLTHTQLWHFDIAKLDSMYNSWNERVQAVPTDEQSWRNLFEIYLARMVVTPRQKQHAYKKACNIMARMEQAIPDTYTFNYCAYEGNYEYDKYTGEPYGLADYQRFRNRFADRAIALLPEDAQADDYECWVSYLYMYLDTVRLTDVLTHYYESGLYPAAALHYHYNELQGMDEGAIYLGATEGDIIGKLMLQRVKGVHRDKILYNENAISWRPYLEAFFRQAGLSEHFFDPDGVWATSEEQTEEMLCIVRYICEHSKRPVYTSASSLSRLILGYRLPDDIKACLYNEGLTMRYAAKPYDNQAVKRRNVEERYLLEYLRMEFSPRASRMNTQRFQQDPGTLAFNYLLLFNDLLPYYKKHNPKRHAWLNSLFTEILDQMASKNIAGYGFGGSMFHIEKSDVGGPHYEVIQEPYNIEDENDDDATRRQKRDEQKRGTRVIVKTEPVALHPSASTVGQK